VSFQMSFGANAFEVHQTIFLLATAKQTLKFAPVPRGIYSST
jgi:hypothetical protein